MAYSMNWRPSQDDTEQSDASVKSIGALGEVKTGTPQSDHAKLGRVQTRTSPANGKSYSMNWRPESPEEPSSLELQPRFATLTTSQKSLPKKQETPAKSTVRKEFLCSLNNKYCPVVHCFGRDSYTAAVDGTSLALEKSKSRAEWKMRWLPAEVDLEERGIQSLARAIYACVYAAMSENRLDDITITTLEHPGTPWPRNISSFRRALDSMGLTLSTTLTISNLHVLQLLVLLYPALIRPPLPYSQQSSVISESSNGCKVSHPARRPLKVVKDGTVVYSRWISGWSCHLNVSRSCVDDVYRVNVAMDHQDGRDADEPYSFSIYWALEHLGNEKRRDRRTIGDYDRYIVPHNPQEDQFINFNDMRLPLVALCHFLLMEEPQTSGFLVREEDLNHDLDEDSAWSSATVGNHIDVLVIKRAAFWDIEGDLLDG